MVAMSSIMLLMAVLAVPVPPTAVPIAAPPSQEQVLEVPAPLRALVRERVVHPGGDQVQRLERLVTLMFTADGLALHYAPDANGTIAETWQTRQVNCLTFSLLFTALAREAGIDARLQEVGQVLSWYQDDAAIYNVGHVNVAVRAGGRTGTVDLDADVLYDQHGPQPITAARALAHFYNNRGADLLTGGRLEEADIWFRQALLADPRFAQAWNNLGVLRSRQHDDSAADQAWRTALQLQPRNVPALANAMAFHQRRGELDRARALEASLQKVRRYDPFHQFLLGLQAERGGDNAVAAQHYRRAIRLYPQAHQFHFGLARVAFNQGHLAEAVQALEQAKALGADPDKRRYQAKLDSLQRLQRQQASRGSERRRL